MGLVLNQLKPMIYSYFGEKGSEVWKLSKSQTKILKNKYPLIRKNIREIIYSIAGVYIAMQEYISAEDAKRIMVDYAPMIGNRLRRILLFATGFPGVTNHLWKNIDRLMAKSGSEAKGYKSKIYGKHGDEATMDVLVCPVYEAFKTIGTPEIATVVCEMDLIYSTGYKGIEFTRTKALANGDDCCDYKYKVRLTK